MREAGALDCEGASEDRSIAAGSGPRCSRVSVGVRTVVIAGTQFDKSPGVCLGGSIVLVKSRHVRERRLRPQAGCHVQPFNPTPVNAPLRFSFTTEADLAWVVQLQAPGSPIIVHRPSTCAIEPVSYTHLTLPTILRV